MGKKKDEENPNPSELKEGLNFLGAPTFEKLENGRFKCVETGHELPDQARDSYANSKHCRLGLIDVALNRNKPPLNMFKQDPASRSKLICRLTGDTINKTEEHIWKHINGKHFLSMLDKEEAKKEAPRQKTEKRGERKKKEVENSGLKKGNQKLIDEAGKNIDDIINEVRDPAAGFSSDSDDEADFWMPPVSERWDHDDGGDCWGSDSWSGPETEDDGEEADMVTEEDKLATAEITKRTKRMSLEIGPSSFASRKKKKKTDGSR